MHCYLFCVFELWKLIFSPDNKCVTLCFFFYKQLKKEFQCNNKKPNIMFWSDLQCFTFYADKKQ